ncbi:MAG TPA: hypothetical protein VF476_03490 [Chitinophagaceae bacterium]
MQKTHFFAVKPFVSFIAILFCLQTIFQSCEKNTEALAKEEQEVNARKGPKNPPPPPPPPFYFTNCNMNPTYSATFTKGVAANTSFIKNYVNSPGGSYPAFTSATVNGITITAAAGTFNVGSGSVTFTATGTSISTGYFQVWIGVGNIQQCMAFFTVLNQPASGPTVDPGPTEGSTGVVNFIYRGQPVAYTTVRAGDGKIWLQQNLGSPQVAMSVADEASYGDYFQWGRWDDGHQAANSATIIGGASLLNPSAIPSGFPNFIVGTTAATKWWGTGGLSTDTWSGSTSSFTNGKDPCVALGPGWRLPTATDWQNLKSYDDLDGALAAYMSNLKLPAAGFRAGDGGFVYKGGESYYWTSTANNSYATGLFISDNTYLATLQASLRGDGYNCRCVKD